MKEKAFQFIDGKKDEMVSLWRDLVNMESGSAYVEGVDAVANRVKKELEESGAKARLVEYEKAGNMALGEIPGGAKAPVLFCGHMDTVFKFGEVAKRPFTIKDGIAYGPGVLDMKGGIVIAIYAARALRAAGYRERPLKFAFAGDEEIAHPHSNAADVFVDEAKGCAAAFDCETGFVDNSVVVGRKGMATFKAAVHGVAAHAGNDPKRGRSAILEMAHKIIDIQNLTNWEEGYTFNVGVIEGGTVVNAVPGYCEIAVDIRYVDPAITGKLKDMVEKTLAKTYIEGTRTELKDFRLGINAMKTTDSVKKLFELWKKTSEENGFGTPSAIVSGGASDAAYTVMGGAPSLCSVGVKGGKNHSPDEFAVVDALFERAKLLAATILKLDEI
ncbi:MAG: M20 family metallopeptidase [Acidaminococcales bacterium]|jgi:glutamate carboxypeptidase|nr:M20 family metallopeptidase [Acidaminococcales bacterium]